MTSEATAAEDVWLGLDLGTQSVRAVAVTGDGNVVGAGSHPLASHREGNRHEQDPEEWWKAVCSASRQALRTVRTESVKALAVDATSGTVLLSSPAGDPLTPALMYDDSRAAAYVERVNEVGESLWTELGYRRMQPAWALPKLLWLLEHCGSVTAGARISHQSDFVNRRLVGSQVPTDLGSALKTGAHLIDETWPTDIFDALMVPSQLLPELVRPGTRIGAVCPEAADATGIPAGVAVLSGTTDGCAAQLGAGALSVGSWNSVLGTTLVLKGVSRDLIHDPLGAVYSHKAPNGDWLPGGASSTGAGAITRDFPGRDLADLDRRASEHEPANVVSYPLAGAGERFPFVAPDAQGFTLGEASDESVRFAALLQGVAFVERLCFDYLDQLGAPVGGALSLTGGATASAYWCQLRADILGREVVLPANAEPALGAAVLAASAGRQVADVAAEMVRVRETIEPRPGTRGRYDSSYHRLVDEWEQRGWLRPEVATHARERTP